MMVADKGTDVWRLRHCATLTPKPSKPLDDLETVSFLPMEAIGEDGALRFDSEVVVAEAKSGYTYFENGDVVVAKITPCFENGKGALISNLVGDVGFGTTELHVLRAKPNLDPRFLWWLTASPGFRDQGTATMLGAGGQKRVTPEFVLDFRFALPSVADQQKIADFLDRETAKIDALIAEKERLLKLLDERRQALITEAVTRGLDPTVPMKPSGLPWLGDIPAHWKVTRLANLFSEASDVGIDELPILSVSIHHGVSDSELGEDELVRKVARSEDRSKYKRVAPGDLVYNMMRAWQGGFGAVKVEGMVSPAYVVARPTKDVYTQYIELLLRTPMATQEIRRRSHGIIDFRLRLYWEEFRSLSIPLPSLPDQRLILDHVSERCSIIDGHVEVTRDSVDLLWARRTALIHEAVTGQLPIGGAA